MTFDEAMAYALTLPGVERSTHYGDPAAKANGHAILAPGREDDSFCLMIDLDTKAMLMATEPETYWQTPHYDGWPSVLVRYDAIDEDRVREMIDRAYQRALVRKPPRKKA